MFLVYCTKTTINLTMGEPASIKSPLEPYNYPPNMYCEWVITTDAFSTIVVRFLTFRIEPTWDNFIIGLGKNVNASTEVVRLSGTLAPRIVVINNSSAIWFLLTSDESGQLLFGVHVEVELSSEPGKFFHFHNIDYVQLLLVGGCIVYSKPKRSLQA